ncbi:MAG: aspartate/glutamate racemase family protein [Candidatus Peribacteraceae bacterium]|jgi:aspartate racemase|nr:aspartate/glutamate racemase family protein [Candidatus Peribacteraceae bacterium]|tara:strand:+ start:3161 stop:3850 length:690 start_codon:yes stop_codon:yes gene_type:complete
MKTLGIIGNVGVDGTCDLMKEIMQEIDRRKVKILPRITMEGVKVNRDDEKRLLTNEETEDFIEPVQQSAKLLADRDLDIIVLACNTLHVLEPEIRAATEGTRSKFLSLPEAVVAHLKEQNITIIGIIGTGVASKLFSTLLRKANIQEVLPEQPIQDELIQSVVRIVTGEEKEGELVHTQRAIDNICQQGAQAFLIACTDLSHLQIDTQGLRQFDSTTILAKEVVNQLLA